MFLFIYRYVHDHLLSTDVLAHVAKNIGLGDLLLCAVSFQWNVDFRFS